MRNHDFPTRPVRRAPPGVHKEVLSHVARLAKKSGAMDPKLASQWPDIAGEQLARICRPVRLKPYGKALALEVSVPHGAAATMLQYQLKPLLERINQFMGYNRIVKIDILQRGIASQKGASLYSTSPLATKTNRKGNPIPASQMPAPAKPDDLEGQLVRMKRLMAVRAKMDGDAS